MELAQSHIAQTVIRAPIAGVVYDLAARPGVYLNIGDLVANVGQTGRLRVRVYVDEPELGRVAEGQPVTINWDALPGRAWQGTVERKPANIVPLGSRQVGEVLCTIDNPGRVLLPGTNVDAHIRTATVANALTIRKGMLAARCQRRGRIRAARRPSGVAAGDDRRFQRDARADSRRAGGRRGGGAADGVNAARGRGGRGDLPLMHTIWRKPEPIRETLAGWNLEQRGGGSPQKAWQHGRRPRGEARRLVTAAP